MGSLVKCFHCLFKKIYSHKILIFICFIITSLSCNSVEPINEPQLKLEEVSCTEAWINVTGETGSEITLNRNDKEVQRFTLVSSPQTVYDDSLLPNKTYTYQAVQNNKTSSKITVTTLDTTSSNFNWEVDTIGAEGSVLYDVTVINDTLAYAVGLIIPSDSAERANTIYWNNTAVWNGTEWTPMQVPFYYKGQKTFTTLYAVFAFGPNDILFSGGGGGTLNTGTEQHLLQIIR